tara:strand:- start:6305 stop:7039 length:735 start_codon:yes stop_codon:yes gene_type:complete
LSVVTESVLLEGGGDIYEITRFPSFILHVKVTPRHFKDATKRPQCFVSVFSTAAEEPVGFDPETQQHLLPFNTTDSGGSDEYTPPDNTGPHIYAPNGIFIYSDFLEAQDVDNDKVMVSVSYVIKNDYAGAYDAIDCYRGSRWANACGRDGVPFLENYGGYPPEFDPEDDTDVPAEDSYSDPPPIPADSDPVSDPPPDNPYSGTVTSNKAYAKLTDHTGGRMTSDIFKQIEAFPIPDNQDPSSTY